MLLDKYDRQSRVEEIPRQHLLPKFSLQIIEELKFATNTKVRRVHIFTIFTLFLFIYFLNASSPRIISRNADKISGEILRHIEHSSAKAIITVPSLVHKVEEAGIKVGFFALGLILFRDYFIYLEPDQSSSRWANRSTRGKSSDHPKQ